MQNFVKTYNVASPDLRYHISLAKMHFLQVKCQKTDDQIENLTKILKNLSENIFTEGFPPKLFAPKIFVINVFIFYFLGNCKNFLHVHFFQAMVLKLFTGYLVHITECV